MVRPPSVVPEALVVPARLNTRASLSVRYVVLLTLTDSSEGCTETADVVLAEYVLQMTPTRLDALATLRSRTSTSHRRLETGLGLMSDDLTMGRYVVLLSRFAALHQTLDDQIASALVPHAGCTGFDGLDIEGRRKMPSLRTDLAALNQRMPPPCGHFDDISSVAGALGAMYVCEGASLGGRVIGPRVRTMLGDGTPTDYFESYGDDVADRWATFRRALVLALVTDDDIDAAVTGAVGVFDRFSAVLLGD